MGIFVQYNVDTIIISVLCIFQLHFVISQSTQQLQRFLQRLFLVAHKKFALLQTTKN